MHNHIENNRMLEEDALGGLVLGVVVLGETLKRCTKCLMMKVEEDFYWQIKNVRRDRRCKKCCHAQQKEYKQTDKGKASTKKANTKHAKTDKFKASQAKYRKTPKGIAARKKGSAKHAKTDKGKETAAKASAKHRKTDKFKETRAEYSKSDARKESSTKYKKTVKGKASEEKYQKSDKGKATQIRGRATRRAKEKELPNTLTGEQWNQIQSGQDHKCAGCGMPFTEEKPVTADHIHPVCKGGGTTEENIQALCKSCNSIKGPRPMSFLTERLEEKRKIEN